MTSPDLNQQPLCIEYHTLDVDFELKSGLIHLLPTFRGLAGEDPHKHIKEFHVVCSGMRPQGVPEEQVKLRAFPFSLGDKAKDWLYSLPSETIVSWNELKKQFLENYFPASRTRNIRLVDAASGGALYDKNPTEARKLITTMAAKNQQVGNRSDNPPRKEGLNRSKLVGFAHLRDIHRCLPHPPRRTYNACQCRRRILRTITKGHDPFSNTYNPGWRDHPNLRYGNQPQNFQRPPYQQPPPPQTNSNSGTSLEDMIKILVANTQQFQQETRASIQNLESQVSQLASSVSRLESQVNKSYNSKIALGVGKHKGKIDDSIECGHVEQGKTGEELKILPKQAKKSNLTHAEHPKVFVSKPPFPERFAKSRKKEEEREILETLPKVEVNIPLLDVIKQVPRYAKFLKELCTNKSKLRGNERVSMGENVFAILQRKLPPKCKDPGMFSIPCKIGNIGIEKAMCDLGVSINVMPLSIYKSLKIGPLKETGVVNQLADRSIVYPEGVLEDILVQVNELIFPADFYVLDMTENTSPNSTSILLGRPFLKTSKTKIDVDAGILSMEFDNEVVKVNTKRPCD
ncbi:UNVERIFIED_CONTAM: hypothetical protein Sangu_2445100 [Sesamum angustifolium]|uniref:Retrotransposon gag domain-containing protein n=1 Tax=Sesamum angustifolium TaxID=2727405 RepID=A0AAW2KWP2_9LAMI